jgi:hypothetical protein
MNLPGHLAGMTVACPHCKKPFQVPSMSPQAEAVLNPEEFNAPRPRRSLDSGPGMSRWLWIILGTACAGALIAVIAFLPSRGGMKDDLKKARVKQLYERIKQGTRGSDAIKYAKEVMAELPGDSGELKYDEPSEEDGKFLHVFEKGPYRIIISINATTDQVVLYDKKGF